MRRTLFIMTLLCLFSSGVSADVLFSTGFERSEGYQGKAPLADQPSSGPQWKEAPNSSNPKAPYINTNTIPDRVFEGNASAQVDGKETTGCYVDFNTDPSLKKVWVEAYVTAFYNLSGNGCIRIGLVKAGATDPNSHMQAVVKIPGFESGNTLYFNTAGGYPKGHAKADCLYKPGKWIHVVMEVDYNTSTAKVYSRIVDSGDTSPLRESDAWTYTKRNENVGDLITVSGKNNDTVTFVTGSKDYAGRLWIEGVKGVWGFVDNLKITDHSPIITRQDILDQLSKKNTPDNKSLSKDAPTPLVVVPRMSKSPKLDGRIKEDEWDKASIITGFSNLQGQLAPQQTKVRLGYDQENLYVAFESTTDYRQQLPQEKIWYGDAFEFFLDMPGDRGYIQFVGNAAGIFYTGLEKGKSRKAPDWKMANFRNPDAWKVGETWSVEVAVPFAELGLHGPPKDGDRWRANFCRDWSSAPSKEDRYTSWAPINGSYNQVSKFGTVIFQPKGPAVQLQKFGRVSSGHPDFQGRILSDQPENRSVGYTVQTATDQPLTLLSKQKNISCKKDGVTPFQFSDLTKFDTTLPIPVRLLFDVKNPDGSLLQRTIFPYTMEPAFRVEVVPIFLQNRLDVVFDVRNISNVSPDVAGEATVIGPEGNCLDKAKVIQLGKKGFALLPLHLPEHKPGRYIVNAVLKKADGSVWRKITQPVDVPKKPDWYKNKLGISEKVPPPFEDVRVKGKTVTVWGRSYNLGELLLPKTIQTDGTQILAESIRLICTAAGRQQNWSDTRISQEHAKPTDAVFTLSSKGKGVSITGRLSAEYDGILIYDLDVAPRNGPVSISELSLEIPLHRKDAAFLRATTWPMCTMGVRGKAQAALIGDVKPETPRGYFPNPTKDYVSVYNYAPDGWNWGNEFIPQLWVGNDAHGLFYFQSSSEGMNWKGSPVDVIHRGQTTIIRIKYINVDTVLQAPRHYKFALMATPFKKRDRRMERIAFDPPSFFANLVKEGRLPKGFIPAVVHWCAGRFEKDYEIVDPEQLRNQIAETRKEGMEVILNNSSCLCVKESPEFALYGSEWIQQPTFRYSNHEGTNFTLIKVCPASSFPDYHLGWAKNLMEKYNLGGLYFDVSAARKCMNPHHRHGYIKDGVRQVESDMFALREFYKRIYTMTKEEGMRRGREFYVYQHSGSAICWPYIDMLCRGEYWERAGKQIKSRGWWTITPTYFRTVENVLPMGGAYTFFSGISDRTDPKSPGPYQRLNQEKLAVLLLLDILPCADNWMTPLLKEQWPDKNKPGLIDIWKIWEDFDVEHAEWVPYYKNDTRLSASSPDLKVSFYTHKGRLLVVASNMTRKAIHTSLKIDRKRLGFTSDPLKVKDLGTDETTAVSNEEIPLNVDARDFRMLLIEE